METTVKFAEFFEVKTRDNGERYYCLTDAAPAWMADAVREAHDDEMPNDWRYQMCARIFEAIDNGETEPYLIADSLVMVYTSDLLKWVRENLHRTGLVDDILSGDVGMVAPDSLSGLLMAAQAECIGLMADVILQAVLDNAE